VEDKLKQLKTTYTELIKNNNKKMFLFCLDSFYFQYKILNTEMEHIHKMITIVNNRMYGDYYKLYNILVVQINDLPSQQDKQISVKKYPAYKDLDPLFEYKISDMTEIHKEILSLVNLLYGYYSSKEQNINKYSINPNMGLSISNFIHTLEYENTLLKEQISLYTGYITFFHVSQRNYLIKLHTKLVNFQKEIEDDIHMNSRTDSLTPTAVELDLRDFMTEEEEKAERAIDLAEKIMDQTSKLIENIEEIVSSDPENIVMDNEIGVANTVEAEPNEKIEN
jgi:hypothetical protein